MYKFEMSTQNNIQTQVAVPCKQISSIKFGEWRERERERAKYYKNLCFNSIEAVAGREKCIKTLFITLNESGEGVGVL